MRYFPLKAFDRDLIYYFGLPTRIEVIRLWNSVRGLDALMEGTE